MTDSYPDVDLNTTSDIQHDLAMSLASGNPLDALDLTMIALLEQRKEPQPVNAMWVYDTCVRFGKRLVYQLGDWL